MKESVLYPQESLRFARQIAAIAAFELGKTAQPNCLLIGEGSRADALSAVLVEKYESVARVPAQGETYALIVLLDDVETELWSAHTGKDTVVLDAAQKKGHTCCFDPSHPYRLIRVLSLEGETAEHSINLQKKE